MSGKARSVALSATKPPVIAGRVPPSDGDAEMAVLSSCLLDGAAIDEVADLLTPESFYSDANGLIFKGILALHAAGQPVDILQVATWLRDREQIQRIGGASFLGQLVDATPAVAHVRAHAQVVADKHRLRTVIATMQHYAAHGYSVSDFAAYMDEAEGALFAAFSADESAAEAVTLAEALTETFAAMTSGEICGYPLDTNVPDLTKKMSLDPGKLIILGARPGMGKSALVLQWLRERANVDATWTRADGSAGAYDNAGGIIFSLEMGKVECALRLVCQEASVPYENAKNKKLSNQDWADLSAAAGRIAARDIIIDASPEHTIQSIRSRSRKLAAQLRKQGKHLGLIVVDYLQLMSAHGFDNREQAIASISRGLKLLAKELGCAIIALSQLNRGCENRTDKRPILSDLRESGAIEQDADAVLFMYRDDYYKPKDGSVPLDGLTELIIEKHRGGPTGMVKLEFLHRAMAFAPWVEDHYQAA